MSLEARLEKIRSPNLQNQKQVAVVLNAVEDILRDQKTEFTPTAYFVALLSLLPQSISSSAIVNKDLAGSTVYLLDLFTPHTPTPLLRSKFEQILNHLAPALTHPEADAPLLRSSIGVLESLLVAQDGSAWAPKDGIPRRAVQGLLHLGLDDRPKVRKRAQEALTNVLKNPPPSPSLDHPAADMCAATTLESAKRLVKQSEGQRKKSGEHDPRLIHSLQLVRAVAAAGGWPSKRIEGLCEVLLEISRSSNEIMTMAAFGVFEEMFASLVDDMASAKLPGVLEAISELRPSRNDSQLLPPWLAVIARGYEVFGQVSEDEAFMKLPALFDMISGFLESSAHNIRTSASQCLISLIATCIPDRSLLNITRSTEKVFKHIAKTTTNLLSVRYQGAWNEVFDILGALFEQLRWRSTPILDEAVKVVGDLRANEGFQGKKQADEVLAKAIHAMGSDAVLTVLPLNLTNPGPGQPGRAWMLPILRDALFNARLGHFREEMIPLSDQFYQRVVDFGEEKEKTLDIKIFETLVGQIWALFPGYCDLPVDLIQAFDQSLAEMLANVLYQKVDLRVDICKGLQNLIDSNKAVLEMEPDEDGEEDLVAQRRITKEEAQKNIDHLSAFSGNMLAVLFNVYAETLPQFRGFILKCLNSFLSITPHQELMGTFEKVTAMLQSELAQAGPQTQAEKQKKKAEAGDKPPMVHTLMDLVITITRYLPADSYAALFAIFNATINKQDDPQLQKKAYKVVPRLAESEIGKTALQAQSEAMQKLLIDAAEKTSPPARRDRLVALSQMIEFLPAEDLHFIPSVLKEVIGATKDVTEKARIAAFDLLVTMGEKMKAGGKVVNSKVPDMPADAPDVDASLEEYFIMVSAGLAAVEPKMLSASVTALTRILYQFKDDCSREQLEDLVSTLDAFLTSKNREVVKSVLGFVKVCVISLPIDLMLARFETLVPNLIVWSHEHKGDFKSKVKHILERMVRRFGYEAVERYIPEDDKKLIINIRKTRERRKRKKDASADNEEDEKPHRNSNRKFADAFDEALYGSDSEDEGEEDDEAIAHAKKKGAKKGQTFIVEDEDEPLDLLDRGALAHISSTKPRDKKDVLGKRRTKAKTNADGKLVLGEDDEDEDEDMGGAADTQMGGVDAYVEAVAGKDAFVRGQRNRVKYSNKRARGDDEDEEMGDVEKEDGGYVSAGKKQKWQETGKRGFAKGRGTRGGRIAKAGGKPRGRR